MKQENLWAPWRIGYVQKKTHGCLFCRVAKAKKDQKNFIIKRGRFSFLVLNIYPYNNGHVMVAPYRHIADFDKLSQKEIADLMHNLIEIQEILKKILKPQGFNIGINIGRVAGAGFPGHIHIHIVPRWNGDTNFMPVITKTKVLSESLEDLYRKIKNAYPG